jgi:hypothetical protein
VHELDRGRELDVAVAGIAGKPCHRQGEDGPQSLAAGRDQMIGDLGNHRHFRSRARQDGGVDVPHVGGHELEQTVDGAGRVAFEGDDDGQERCSERKDARA